MAKFVGEVGQPDIDSGTGDADVDPSPHAMLIAREHVPHPHRARCGTRRIGMCGCATCSGISSTAAGKSRTRNPMEKGCLIAGGLLPQHRPWSSMWLQYNQNSTRKVSPHDSKRSNTVLAADQSYPAGHGYLKLDLASAGDNRLAAIAFPAAGSLLLLTEAMIPFGFDRSFRQSLLQRIQHVGLLPSCTSIAASQT